MSEKEILSQKVIDGELYLGIELGSTRIKAVLIDSQYEVVATGSYEWENKLVNGIWTYDLELVWTGIQEAYQKLKVSVQKKSGQVLCKFKTIGFSAMMHGYLAFDKENNLLVPFRTWRNTNTDEASKTLTKYFDYNIPHRWSIAHLYQAILNQESHVQKLDFLTTLAGYVHWQLTDEKVLGIGDASGMFPIDSYTKSFDVKCMDKFDCLIASQKIPWKLNEILPKVLLAGESAGKLSKRGSLLLDPSGDLEVGISLCPPEGDAGTGMVATNTILEQKGNVSAGTSVFAMIVLEKALKKVHPEIDLVTTPDGKFVGMIHANNCSTDLNVWVNLFKELIELTGIEMEKSNLFELLFQQILVADADAGGLLSYGYYSGESITGLETGCPLFLQTRNSQLSLANFMRMHLYSAFAILRIGLDILVQEENVKVSEILAHGGLFKTPKVGQKILAAVMRSPVAIMETAGEGGAWGMALLAAYRDKRNQYSELSSFLNESVFVKTYPKWCDPDIEDIKGFNQYMLRYQTGLPIEIAAVEYLNK